MQHTGLQQRFTRAQAGAAAAWHSRLTDVQAGVMSGLGRTHPVRKQLYLAEAHWSLRWTNDPIRLIGLCWW
jgi:hypothetical protein